MIINNRVISYKNFLHDKTVTLDDSQDFIDFINAGHDFLIENISKGRPIYGVTTGYGEAGQNYAAFEEAEELQKNLYSFHGCGVGEYLASFKQKNLSIYSFSGFCWSEWRFNSTLIHRSCYCW